MRRITYELPRPIVRPAHHFYQQPNFQFPTRPSTKNGSEALLSENVEDDDQRDSIWTYQSRGTNPRRDHTSILPPLQHARAHSYSTIDDHAVQDWDVGAFKVVIDRPSADGRPKTSGTHSSFPTLEVPIPSYRIGTPRFSVRGTPMIRGPSYAPTEVDQRASDVSWSQRNSCFLGVKRDSRSFHPANPYSHSVASSLPGEQVSVFDLRLPPTGLTGQIPNLMPRQIIVPEMFDSISTFPMCEDKTVVRRNLAGQISAATPARLIVEVTKELNYELVASVFITYRSYITASDLLSLIMARLQHGINQGDNGLVVTVRCFTVIRHWLVNFFIDDFVLDYSLRVEFCDLVNHMVERHAERMTNSKTTNDILSHIKRLWRDSCSTYWDGPEFDIDTDALVPILPGGVAGSRDPKLTPEMFAEILRSTTPRSEPRSEMGNLSMLSRPSIRELDVDESADTPTQRVFPSVPSEQSRQRDVNSNRSGSTARGHRSRPSISERPMSPNSIASVDAFSCSFPLKAGQLASAVGVGAHPVSTTASSVAASSPTIRAPKPMRSNSQRGPRPHRSVSNSSRPERPLSADSDHPGAAEHELYFTDRFAGSFIRGLVLLPPVDIYLPAEDTPISRPSSLPNKSDSIKHEPTHSGGGMKKMFGTVRRAVNKSEGGDKQRHPTHPHLSVALEQTAAIGCAAGAAVVKQCFRGQVQEIKMRPDKLSQFVERDFEAIVAQHRDELDEAEKEPNGGDNTESYNRSHGQPLPAIQGSSPEHVPNVAHSGHSQKQSPKFESFPAFEANEGNTDDANISPSLSQPLPPSTSVQTDWQTSTAPTPPVTPPDRLQDTSQQLGEYGASTADRTPSLVLGLRSPASLDSQPSFRPLKHPSTAQRERKGSSSASIRRMASFHSGYTRQVTERSFDAKTFSAERVSIGSTHAPGNRMLRRRPGGDLRAINTVKNLPLRRYRSTSSLSTYDASLRSSFRLGGTESAGYLHSGTSAIEESRPSPIGALANLDRVSKPKTLSLYSTDSKPVMRPSFQAEAAKLAEIPDDADDDGGVESALLKLEGRYEQRKSQTLTQSSTEEFSRSSEIEFERMFDQPSVDSVEAEKHSRSHANAHEKSSVRTDRATSAPGVNVDDFCPTGESRESASIQDSMYNDIPLLQRSSHLSIYQTKPLDRTQNSFDEAPRRLISQSQISYNHSQESIDIVNKTDSMNNIPPGETLPRHFSALGSYIEVEHGGDHSDLSSEMSMEMLSSQDFSGSAFLNKPSPYQYNKPNTELTIHKPKASYDTAFTMQQALGLLPPRDTYPATPHGTPTIPPPRLGPAMRSWHSDHRPETAERPTVGPLGNADGAQIIDEHYPFVLSFASSLLAQQLTLIETEALSEIHFRELLEIKWSHDAAFSCRSWPRFLQKLSKVEEDDSVSHGIEICAARSSIMTSWAISQVVLTTNLEERAKTVQKLVHIANECRKLGNYATLFQLTVALTNPVLAELHQTWAQVPAADIALLRDLEVLIQPANNFRRLRDEMESVLGKRACIPLVAIYAKDLSALKDMPSYIASTLSEPPLINVTKCKAQAAVVQLVARYLEKSGELRIKPVQKVVGRCLWVGGLRDAEVKEFARGLV